MSFKNYHLCSTKNDRSCFRIYYLKASYLRNYAMHSGSKFTNNQSIMINYFLLNLAALQFIVFEIMTAKSWISKITIGHLRLNRDSMKLEYFDHLTDWQKWPNKRIDFMLSIHSALQAEIIEFLTSLKPYFY